MNINNILSTLTPRRLSLLVLARRCLAQTAAVESHVEQQSKAHVNCQSSCSEDRRSLRHHAHDLVHVTHAIARGVASVF